MPSRSRRIARLRTAIVAITACAALAPATAAQAAPSTEHPRLLITPADVTKFRSWAKDSNPLWAQGLAERARRAKADHDSGAVPAGDEGYRDYNQYPVEQYAELFAFMSLVDPDPAKRADWGKRSRDLLMHAIDVAVQGSQNGAPFRDPEFSVSDRSRWWGEAWGLTVDWAYPYFSAADKAKIRTVFRRWSAEQYDGYPLRYFRDPPRMDRPANDPELIADARSRRWSQNNYYAAHARNLVLMGLALDAADDPGGELRRAFEQSAGQWLFQADHTLRTDVAGGLGAEGFEYSPQTLAYYAQALTAIATSGNDDTAAFGRQVSLAGNPFWADTIPAILSSLPQAPVEIPGTSPGLNWQPAAYGDNGEYPLTEQTPLVVPLALHAQRRGDDATVETVRWMERHVRPGGEANLLTKVATGPWMFHSVLDFMLYDPAAPAAADPRQSLPLQRHLPGLGRTLARSCWCPEARQFVHGLAWNSIDHQTADGNNVDFARKGEWLTKQRMGYGSTSHLTDHTNSVTIRNDKPGHDDGPRNTFWERGSQWYLSGGDPRPVAQSAGAGYTHVTGDATALYNSDHENIADVQHASRTAVWLQPDRIVLYDRAQTGKDAREKRFWLQLPAAPRISGRQAVVDTPGGQRLTVSALLPAAAAVSAPADPAPGDRATHEPMTHRLMSEDPAHPRSVRFLHVLEGTDGGVDAAASSLISSVAGSGYDGAVTGSTAVLFARDLGSDVASTTVDLPAGVSRALVTGLAPGAAYAAAWSAQGSGVRLTVTRGGGAIADTGGVLDVDSGATPPSPPPAQTPPTTPVVDSVTRIVRDVLPPAPSLGRATRTTPVSPRPRIRIACGRGRTAIVRVTGPAVRRVVVRRAGRTVKGRRVRAGRPVTVVVSLRDGSRVSRKLATRRCA